MRYLTLNELLEIYQQVMTQSGGAVGIHDLNALETALAQPRATFAGEDLYPTLAAKAAILGFLLIKNHPFIDGNKRVGHAALEVFLLLNGYELQAEVDEQEAVILSVAGGQLQRAAFTDWLTDHLTPFG